MSPQPMPPVAQLGPYAIPSEVEVQHPLDALRIRPIQLNAKHPVQFIAVVLKAPVHCLYFTIRDALPHREQKRIVVHLAGQTAYKSNDNQVAPPSYGIAHHTFGAFVGQMMSACQTRSFSGGN